jgi:enamine deaminase RidA (YjgF/YER057c/UK114 family)
MEIFSQKSGSFTEHYLVLTVPGGQKKALNARDLYEPVAKWLAKNKVTAIIEKVYGSLTMKDEFTRARKALLGHNRSNPLVSFTYIEGMPVHDMGIAGIQIWGISTDEEIPSGVKDITLMGGHPAREWDFGTGRLLYIPKVYGWGQDPLKDPTDKAQAEQMFERTRGLLEDAGISYADVVRTWIYLPKILDWYDQFNKIRNKFFKANKIGQNPKQPPCPASTAIMGRTGVEACFMDLLAFQADGADAPKIKMIQKTRKQNKPSDYGSAFSRGVSIDFGTYKTVLVSGTASINSKGRTTHQGKAVKQVDETLACIEAVLKTAGGTLKDIKMATCFFQSKDIYQQYLDADKTIDFPCINVIADVCRDDLLVEIEAIAVIE